MAQELLFRSQAEIGRQDVPELFPSLPANPRLPQGGGPRRVLLLQGPVGPFFSRLQAFLDEAGFDCWRICFNAGDLVYARRRKRLRFGGGEAEWQAWLEAACRNRQIGCIVLFGSERPAHRIARAVAQRHGVRVISLEEGYIRPGYVTVEEGGNNASSPIAGRLAPSGISAPEEPAAAVRYPAFWRMVFHAWVYFTARGLAPLGASELHHRSAPLLTEAWHWARNGIRRVRGGERNFAMIQDLLEHRDGSYYLVPLQVAADANLKSSALGWDSPRLVKETIDSFARAAPPGTQLVFKIHPMERGHNRLTPAIRRLARAARVADRVKVVETGSLGLLARHARGMITINSTSGLSAIYHGIPLLVIGEAIYAHPRLAICARGEPSFDRFWRATHVAHPSVRQHYLDWLRQEALKPGDFYHPRGMEAACLGILQKMAELEDRRPARQQKADAA